VDNDANCAALAESTLGAARGTRASITVTLGTGVGCGIVAGGRAFHGGATIARGRAAGRNGRRCPRGADAIGWTGRCYR